MASSFREDRGEEGWKKRRCQLPAEQIQTLPTVSVWKYECKNVVRDSDSCIQFQGIESEECVMFLYFQDPDRAAQRCSRRRPQQEGLNPLEASLRGVCMFFTCLRDLSGLPGFLGPKTCTGCAGDSKVTLGMNACLQFMCWP